MGNRVLMKEKRSAVNRMYRKYLLYAWLVACGDKRICKKRTMRRPDEKEGGYYHYDEL